MELKFRKIRADEVDVRIGTCSEKGVSLLLYKDARCDMNILDETVGATGWKREHSRDNANCTVSIYDTDKKEWVSKEDTGTESNTEKEKGLASDSFKRACVNWGIGRELYTAPFIWIAPPGCAITDRNGKKACYDRFRADALEYDERGNISRLAISNIKTNRTVYTFGMKKAETQRETEAHTLRECLDLMEELNYQGYTGNFMAMYHVNDFSRLTQEQLNDFYGRLMKKKGEA